MSSRSTHWPRIGAVLLTLACLASCSASPSAAPPAQPTSTPSEKQVNCAVEHCVALTFDDGPGKFTDRLLDELDEAGVPATFFMVGQNIAKYPQVLQRMVDAGHQLGSHTWDHADITTLTKEQIEHELEWTSAAIEKASGSKPTVFRPPYGEHGAVYDRLVPYPLVLWDVDTMDWKHHDPKKTVSIAIQEVRPGSIILMHDIHESSIEAVPDLVAQLKAKGYVPVTVDQLFHGNLENSVAYSAAPQPAADS